MLLWTDFAGMNGWNKRITGNCKSKDLEVRQSEERISSLCGHKLRNHNQLATRTVSTNTLLWIQEWASELILECPNCSDATYWDQSINQCFCVYSYTRENSCTQTRIKTFTKDWIMGVLAPYKQTKEGRFSFRPHHQTKHVEPDLAD